MKICKVAECDKKSHAYNFCPSHYWKETQPGGSLYEILFKGICRMEGCERHIRNDDLCSKHLQRLRKYGDPSITKQSYGESRKKDPLYETYCGIKQRIDNPNCPEYKFYGGLGKKLCAGWRGVPGFQVWKKDMGPKPSKDHSIDRIDNNMHYSCGHCEECLKENWIANCRWANRSDQAANRKSNNKIVGVSFDNNKQLWVAQMIFKKEKVLNKYSKNYDDAVAARKEAELKYLGYYIGEKNENDK